MTTLTAKSEELERWLKEQDKKVSSVERIPVEIQSFLEDFQGSPADYPEIGLYPPRQADRGGV